MFTKKNLSLQSKLINERTMGYANIIGRKDEISCLERRYNSSKSEFIAIYGRRRVGKSFLVSEVFGKNILFKAVVT